MMEYITELASAPSGVLENSHAFLPVTKGFIERSARY
jgi:hypothetical protein